MRTVALKHPPGAKYVDAIRASTETSTTLAFSSLMMPNSEGEASTSTSGGRILHPSDSLVHMKQRHVNRL